MTDYLGNNLGSSSPTSNSQSTSTGTGFPVVVNTPQSDWNLAFAREAANGGQKLYDWAGQQYKYLGKLANEVIPQFLQSGANASAMGDQQFSQYMNTYAPAMERFNETANSYASAGRQAYEAGAAEADATQAAHSSWMDTLNNLRSYGIDPSSGLYAGIKSAADTAAGASAAGAGNQAMRDVQKTGLGLQEQNITFGQSLPASALNAVNAQNTALSGAVNTGESAVNTGTNAYGGANNFYQTAMQGKLPVSGQQTQNSSESTSQTGGGFPAKGGNYGIASGGVVPGGVPDDYRRGGHVRRPKMGGKGGGASGATGTPVPHSPLVAEPDGTYSNVGFNYNLGAPAPSGGGLGSTPRPMPPPSRGGGLTLPSSAPMSNSADSGAGIPDDSMGAAQGGPMDPKMAQPPGHQGRPHPPHPYHMNGLPDASTGGHIPYELSPSHGHTTDDVVANLNAGEFVLPRRTVHHVGHKFLYDIIAKSDKEMGLQPQPVGAEPVKPGSGAGKARAAAESQNFSSGGGI